MWLRGCFDPRAVVLRRAGGWGCPIDIGFPQGGARLLPQSMDQTVAQSSFLLSCKFHSKSIAPIPQTWGLAV